MKTIAVTRPLGEGSETAQFIRDLGWDPFILHTVELRPRGTTEIFSEVRRIVSGGPVDWFVLMSPRGVGILFDSLKSHGELLRAVLGKFRFVAVGPRTRDALYEQEVRDVSMPRNYSSYDVATFLSSVPLEGKRIVLARSSDANDNLANTLSSKGAKVMTLRLYSSSTPEDVSSATEFLARLNQERVAATLFTSALSASNLFRIVERSMKHEILARLLGNCKVGAIGPVTASRLRELGVEPDIVPERYLINEGIRLTAQAIEERQTVGKGLSQLS